MVNKDIFEALLVLLGDGSVEIPDIEQIRAISKVNKASKEERERNREINIITAKIRGRAAGGYFDLGEYVPITFAANIEALVEKGYKLYEDEEETGLYSIWWDAEIIEDEPTEPDEGEEEPEVPEVDDEEDV